MGSVVTNNGLKIIINRAFKSTPDYNEISDFKVGTGTTTPTISDTDVETVVTINGGNTKNIETNYPEINETNKTVKVRTRLSSVEANGNALSEQGLFNDDGTPLMFSHHTFTSFSKSDTDELIFEETILFNN